MTLADAGMTGVEVAGLARRGITTMDELRAFIAAHPNWREKLGRVLGASVETFLATRA